MLLVAVLGGLLLAFVLRGFQNVSYVPVLMPLFAGYVLGTGVARVRVRFVVPPRGPAIASAVLGAVVAYGAYHLLVYTHVMDFLTTQLPTFEDRLASDPAIEVQRWLETHTGEAGFSAYFAFVGQPENAAASPLGMLARVGLGAGGIIAATIAELALVCGFAGTVAVWRSAVIEGGPRRTERSERRVREILARVDASTLADAMETLDAGHAEATGRLLRDAERRSDAAFVVAMIHDPFATDAHVLEVRETTDDGGLGTVRARRELPSWDGQALMDALRSRDPT